MVTPQYGMLQMGLTLKLMSPQMVVTGSSSATYLLTSEKIHKDWN